MVTLGGSQRRAQLGYPNLAAAAQNTKILLLWRPASASYGDGHLEPPIEKSSRMILIPCQKWFMMKEKPSGISIFHISPLVMEINFL
jgi:hypothetical protein